MTLWNGLLLKKTRKINSWTNYLLMVALYTCPCKKKKKTSFVRHIQGQIDVLVDLWLPKLFRNSCFEGTCSLLLMILSIPIIKCKKIIISIRYLLGWNFPFWKILCLDPHFMSSKSIRGNYIRLRLHNVCVIN